MASWDGAVVLTTLLSLVDQRQKETWVGQQWVVLCVGTGCLTILVFSSSVSWSDVGTSAGPEPAPLGCSQSRTLQDTHLHKWHPSKSHCPPRFALINLRHAPPPACTFLLPRCILSLVGPLALLAPPPKASPCWSTSSLFPESISLGSSPSRGPLFSLLQGLFMPDPRGNWTEAHAGPERGLLGAGQGAAARQDCLSWSLGLMGC